jgi:7-carboxy-7-deazaguanine synthase
MKGRINEVFHSLQGEGLYAGEPQVFVRLYGCNLNCSYCDTPLRGFKEYEPQELFEQIKSYKEPVHSVAFTGGEPLLQKDFLQEVMRLTTEAGYKNYLETNGTLFFELRDVIDHVHIVAMDLKLSSSTGMGNLWWMHRKFLQIASRKEVFLKAIVCEATLDEDFCEALGLIKEVLPGSVLVLQPNNFQYGTLLAEKLVSYRKLGLEQGVEVRVIPQMHKEWGMK